MVLLRQDSRKLCSLTQGSNIERMEDVIQSNFKNGLVNSCQFSRKVGYLDHAVSFPHIYKLKARRKKTVFIDTSTFIT